MAFKTGKNIAPQPSLKLKLFLVYFSWKEGFLLKGGDFFNQGKLWKENQTSAKPFKLEQLVS